LSRESADELAMGVPIDRLAGGDFSGSSGVARQKIAFGRSFVEQVVKTQAWLNGRSEARRSSVWAFMRRDAA
jgi:hypothetical protein